MKCDERTPVVNDGILGHLTDPQHWEGYHRHASRISPRLPSRLRVSTANVLNLLGRQRLKGKKVLEIGYAPGKVLAWCASRGAQVTGIDASPTGVAAAQGLFTHLGLSATHWLADAFSHQEGLGQFDIVYSVGVVEHFTDPSAIIARHLAWCRPGGRALILLPNYGGIYGALQRHCDPANLGIHNLDIMRTGGFDAHVPREGCAILGYRRMGRPHLELVSLERKLGSLGMLIRRAANVLGWLTPGGMGFLAPLWLLEVEKSELSEGPCPSAF